MTSQAAVVLGGFSVNRKKPIFLKNRFDRFVFRQKTEKSKKPRKIGKLFENCRNSARSIISGSSSAHGSSSKRITRLKNLIYF